MQFSSILDANLPHDLQRAAVGVVLAEYRQTNTEVWRRWPEPEAKDLEPYIRRANIETGLIELHNRFPADTRIATGTTSKGNNYRYLICGDLVVTQSYVEDGRRVPREAVFRNGFAGDPNQMWLHPEAEAERVQSLQDRELTYVLLTHTPSLQNRAEPSHVSLVLVDRDCHYVSSVNLIEHLAATATRTIEPEVVEDRRVAKLRQDIAANHEKGA